MISGAHVILYSADGDADRAFLQDILGTNAVDAGGGWTIVALPPAEIAVHPTEGTPKHELYFMTDNLDETMRDLGGKGVEFVGGVTELRWGRLTAIKLPSGAEVGIYEPKHPIAFG